jgi:hypothetical protein
MASSPACLLEAWYVYAASWTHCLRSCSSFIPVCPPASRLRRGADVRDVRCSTSPFELVANLTNQISDRLLASWPVSGKLAAQEERSNISSWRIRRSALGILTRSPLSTLWPTAWSSMGAWHLPEPTLCRCVLSFSLCRIGTSTHVHVGSLSHAVFDPTTLLNVGALKNRYDTSLEGKN